MDAPGIESKAAERLLTGRAWDDFCETVRQAGHMVDRFGTEANDLDRAEWHRFVTRLMRMAFERFMENCEPERPRLRDAPWRQGINFQSPDQTGCRSATTVSGCSFAQSTTAATRRCRRRCKSSGSTTPNRARSGPRKPPKTSPRRDRSCWAMLSWSAPGGRTISAVGPTES